MEEQGRVPGSLEIAPWSEAVDPSSLPSSEAPPHQWITSAVLIPMLIFLLLTAGVLIFIKQYSQGR